MQSIGSTDSLKIREQIVVNNARYVHNDMCNVERVARMPFTLAPYFDFRIHCAWGVLFIVTYFAARRVQRYQKHW